MFSIHCDESSDAKKQFIFTLAGYVGWNYAAVDLAFEWEKLLERENLPYFRASQCEGGFGPFSKYRDDPSRVDLPLSSAEKNRLKEVKTKFVTVANNADLLGIAVGAVAEDFNKLIAEDPKNAERLGGDPYFLAYKALLMDAGLMMGYLNKKWRSAHVLAPIFDENEEVSGRATQMYDQFRKENPQVSKWLVGMSYERDTRFLALQAADNLAYEVNKWLFNAKYDAQRKERRAMTRLLERVYKIAQFDGRVLEEILVRGLTENIMYDALILQDFDIYALARYPVARQPG